MCFKTRCGSILICRVHLSEPFIYCHLAVPIYSRVPNKRTGHLLENEKKSHLYALIWNYTFINFQ